MGGIDNLDILRHMGVDLSHIPLGPPPPGLKSNFVNPKNQKGVAEAVMCIFMVIMILFVTVRMYAKLRISRAPGWDDCEPDAFSC